MNEKRQKKKQSKRKRPVTTDGAILGSVDDLAASIPITAQPCSAPLATLRRGIHESYFIKFG